jgi:hypothetical protein
MDEDGRRPRALLVVNAWQRQLKAASLLHHLRERIERPMLALSLPPATPTSCSVRRAG